MFVKSHFAEQKDAIAVPYPIGDVKSLAFTDLPKFFQNFLWFVVEYSGPKAADYTSLNHELRWNYRNRLKVTRVRRMQLSCVILLK